MIIDLPSPIAVVCHDAGSANHVMSWMKADALQNTLRIYFEGPARQLLESSGFCATPMDSISEALEGAQSLLVGTGWQSNVEFEAMQQASREKIRWVAMLDHWVNYKERFIRNSEEIMPQEIWVVDGFAEREARSIFQKCCIRRKPNIYLHELLKNIQPVNNVTNNELLYILEPIGDVWGGNKPGEFQALDYFFDILPYLSLPEDLTITLRPHPSDNKDKYQSYIASNYPLTVRLDFGQLAESISRSNWVVGCESYALAIALEANRKVYCSIPPEKGESRLPHSDLIYIRDLVTKL